MAEVALAGLRDAPTTTSKPIRAPYLFGRDDTRAQALGALALARLDQQRTDEARRVSRELLEHCRDWQNLDRGVALSWVVDVSSAIGDWSAAREGLLEAKESLETSGSPWDWACWEYQNTLVDWSTGDHERATVRLVAQWPRVVEVGDEQLLENVAELLCLAVGREDPSLAARLYGAILARREASEIKGAEWQLDPLERELEAPRQTIGTAEWLAEESRGRTQALQGLCEEAVSALRS
jgi:hypothetical protein